MKTVNTLAFQTPQFTVLSDSQMEKLHLAALEVLRRTGIRFYHQGALDMLKSAGAFISDGNLAKFPANLVDEAIASAPRRMVMCDRNGEPAVFLEGSQVSFGTGSDCVNLINHETGEYRNFMVQDLINGYRLCDALPNIHFVMSMGIPTDIPNPEMIYDVQMSLMLEHTTKPIVFVTNDKASCQREIEMAAAVAGGDEALREQQHILLYSEPSSPLQQSETAVDKLILIAEAGLPIVHSPAPLMGGTGPVTMASGLALSLAEIFISLVVHQLTQPGAPFIFGAGLHHLDMKSAQICYGSPEFQLTKSAIAQLGRYFSLPTWGYAGCTDAKVLDEQAALEAMLSVMMAKFSGSNLVHDVGYIESGLTCSFELVVLTDELVALSDNLIKGIEVSEETLMLDELDQVGPGGHFMDTEATLSHFRDFWYPSLIDRSRRPAWLNAGGTTLGQRLTQRVIDILADHKTEPLDPNSKQQIQEILG